MSTPEPRNLRRWLLGAAVVASLGLAAWLGFQPATAPVVARDIVYPPSSGGSGVPSRGYVDGFILSNDGVTPNSILDVSAGICVDSTNAVTITGTTFTKSTAGAWVAGSGGNGMGTGLTVANSTWYHAYGIVNAGNYDVYFDTSASAANKPSGTTSFRRLGSFKTDASAHTNN